MDQAYAHLPATMTVKDLARELQMEIHTAYKFVRSGKIRAIWISPGCVRIPREAFIEYLRGA